MTRWVKKNKYYIQSVCRTFNISKSKVQGQWKYTLWRLSDKSNQGVFLSDGDAKLMAEEIINNE